MKKLIVAIVVLMALAIGLKAAYAADDPETKYEVTISVTYNAVSIEEANKIIADALERHKTACKTDVKAKKVGDDGYFTIDAGGNSPYWTLPSVSTE